MTHLHGMYFQRQRDLRILRLDSRHHLDQSSLVADRTSSGNWAMTRTPISRTPGCSAPSSVCKRSFGGCEATCRAPDFDGTAFADTRTGVFGISPANFDDYSPPATETTLAGNGIDSILAALTFSGTSFISNRGPPLEALISVHRRAIMAESAEID